MTTGNSVQTDILERLERQFANCSDSYEAPNGKIMFRIWCNDLAALLKLARSNTQLQREDTAICDACDGSGFGVADTYCGKCGGAGGIPMDAVAQKNGV